MLTLRSPIESDITKIVNWNKGTNKHFLYQWAGRGYTYPLTKSQMIAQCKTDCMVYMIDDEDGDFIGTVEVSGIDREEKVASIGRFLIDPNRRGQGFGKKKL